MFAEINKKIKQYKKIITLIENLQEEGEKLLEEKKKVFKDIGVEKAIQLLAEILIIENAIGAIRSMVCDNDLSIESIELDKTSIYTLLLVDPEFMFEILDDVEHPVVNEGCINTLKFIRTIRENKPVEIMLSKALLNIK